MAIMLKRIIHKQGEMGVKGKMVEGFKKPNDYFKGRIGLKDSLKFKKYLSGLVNKEGKKLPRFKRMPDGSIVEFRYQLLMVGIDKDSKIELGIPIGKKHGMYSLFPGYFPDGKPRNINKYGGLYD